MVKFWLETDQELLENSRVNLIDTFIDWFLRENCEGLNLPKSVSIELIPNEKIDKFIEIRGSDISALVTDDGTPTNSFSINLAIGGELKDPKEMKDRIDELIGEIIRLSFYIGEAGNTPFSLVESEVFSKWKEKMVNNDGSIKQAARKIGSDFYSECIGLFEDKSLKSWNFEKGYESRFGTIF